MDGKRRRDPPTQKQLDALERLGYDWKAYGKPETKGKASDLIQKLLWDKKLDEYR
tara:strand:- start:633 stop:797 length:165 start_codon:yes stop_codon:yes gene_type:complete